MNPPWEDVEDQERARVYELLKRAIAFSAVNGQDPKTAKALAIAIDVLAQAHSKDKNGLPRYDSYKG